MSAGPSLELDSLALRLAVAIDLGMVMTVRAEVVALIEASVKTHRKEAAALRHQARALKREAESVCGELLIWMQASGLRRGHGGDVRTEVGRTRPSIASLTGFSHRTITSRWQRASRSSPPSFNLRLAQATEVETVRSLIAECSAAGRAALRCKDRAAHRIAVARRMAAKRRGGMLLIAGAADGTELPASMAPRWRRLARLSEDAFLAAVERGAEEARHGPEPATQIKMVQTEFQVDERGNLHRKAYAVDAPQSDLKF